MLFVFDNAPYRFYAYIGLSKKLFNALTVRCGPAANRLTVLFVYVGLVHAEVASAGSSDNGFSRCDYLLLGHLWKGDEIFWHIHLLSKYNVINRQVKVYLRRICSS